MVRAMRFNYENGRKALTTGGNGTTDDRGAYRIAGLMPGEYLVSAVPRDTVAVAAGQAEAIRDRMSQINAARPSGEGISTPPPVNPLADPRGTGGVTLRMQRGVSVSGTIALDNLPPTVDRARLRVRFLPVSSATDWEMAPFTATPDAAGKFTLEKVMPGQYRPTVSGLPDGWTLASAIFDEKDAADYHLTIDGSRNVAGGDLTLVPRMGEVGGAVVTASGAPAPEHTVLIFPTDSRLWVPQSRRILVAKPGADGRYALRGLPPGEYRLATLLDPEPGQWLVPEFLAQMVALSTAVTLGEGEKRVQDLKVR